MKIIALIIALLSGINFAHAENKSIAGAHSFVEQNSAKVIAALQSGESDQHKSDQLEAIFVNLMDIDWMGKFAIGKFWKGLDENYKIAYLGTYRKYLISSYISLFKKYQNQKLVIKNVEALDGDQFSVLTEIESERQKAAYNIEYKIKYLADSYKVRDIVAEGVSLLATQRSDFGSIISNGGIENLINKLNEKSKIKE